MIELSNIYKDFDVYNALGFRKSSSLSILRNINCKILHTDSIGIIGKNGSGKSTLLKLIFGAILPDKGTIAIEGKPITEEDTINRFAFLGNNDRSFFWRLTVNENLEYFRGVYNQQETTITKLIFNNLSIDKLSNRPFGNLSSGEKKKVMLYRSLLKNPDIMLFDEFTQSLDLPSKKEIESIVTTLKNEFNKTIIWVSHDLDEIMRICNKVLYIKNGEIKETVELNKTKLNNLEYFQNLITS